VYLSAVSLILKSMNLKIDSDLMGERRGVFRKSRFSRLFNGYIYS